VEEKGKKEEKAAFLILSNIEVKVKVFLSRKFFVCYYDLFCNANITCLS